MPYCSLHSVCWLGLFFKPQPVSSKNWPLVVFVWQAVNTSSGIRPALAPWLRRLHVLAPVIDQWLIRAGGLETYPGTPPGSSPHPVPHPAAPPSGLHQLGSLSAPQGHLRTERWRTAATSLDVQQGAWDGLLGTQSSLIDGVKVHQSVVSANHRWARGSGRDMAVVGTSAKVDKDFWGNNIHDMWEHHSKERQINDTKAIPPAEGAKYNKLNQIERLSPSSRFCLAFF